MDPGGELSLQRLRGDMMSMWRMRYIPREVVKGGSEDTYNTCLSNNFTSTGGTLHCLENQFHIYTLLEYELST